VVEQELAVFVVEQVVSEVLVEHMMALFGVGF